mgnify:CR=1 FL=1
MEKIFNINNYVKVKLTKEGVKILKSQYNEMLKQMTPQARKSMVSFKKPKADKDGYSEFQLWELMKHFGKYMYNGNINPPFESTIKISEEYLVNSIDDIKF